jgi:hypothetical protein
MPGVLRAAGRLAAVGIALSAVVATGYWMGSAEARPELLRPLQQALAFSTLRVYGYPVVSNPNGPAEANRPATAGSNTLVDPLTGRLPEDPPYTLAQGPFSPLSPEAPEMDFVTWNPAWISERLGDPALRAQWPGLTGIDEVSAAAHIRAGSIDASEKVWLRHWYEPQHLDKDLNADGRLTDTNNDGTPDAPVNPRPSNVDEWYPAILTELTYMLVDNDPLPQAMPQPSELQRSAPRPVCGAAGQTQMVFPIGVFRPETDPAGPLQGYGLTSLDANFDGMIDMVNVTDEANLPGQIGGTRIDFDGDNVLETIDQDGVRLSCDELVVLHTDAFTIGLNEQLQFLDHFVRLRSVTNSAASLEIYYSGDLVPRLVQQRSIGIDGVALAGDAGPVQVLAPGGTNLGAVPTGPWFLYVQDVDPGTGTATLILGRGLGAPCASMENGPNQTNRRAGGPSFLKRLYVDGHEYNVVAIYTCSPRELQYLTLRAPLPKVPVTIEQHSVRLQPYAARDPLALPPPFNYEHTILEDIVALESFANVAVPPNIAPNAIPRPKILYMGGPIGPVPPVLGRGDSLPYNGHDPGVVHLATDLTGVAEVPAVVTAATGMAMLTLDLATNELSYELFVENIDDITAAHIHRGPPGVNGAILHTLYSGPPPPFGPGNPLVGSVMLTAVEAAELQAGNLYLNVHTVDFPNGELRGQVVISPQYNDVRATRWFYTEEATNPQFLGQLREKFGAVREGEEPQESFFYNEQIHTLPWHYTQFALPDLSDPVGDPQPFNGDKYYVTSSWTAPTARWRIWTMPNGPVPGFIPPVPPDLTINNTPDGGAPTGAPRRANFWFDPDDPAVNDEVKLWTDNRGVRLFGGQPERPDFPCDPSRPGLFFAGAGDTRVTSDAAAVSLLGQALGSRYRVEVFPYTDPFAPFNPQHPHAPRGDSLTFNPAYMDEFRNSNEELRLLYAQLSNDEENAREKVYHRMWYEPDYTTKVRFADDCSRDLRFRALMQEFTFLYMDTTDNPTTAPPGNSRFAFPMGTRSAELPVPNPGGSLPAGGEFGYGITTFDANFDLYPDVVTVHSEETLNDHLDVVWQTNRPMIPGFPPPPIGGPVLDLDGDGIEDDLDADTTPLNGNEMVVFAVESLTLDLDPNTPAGSSAMFLDHLVTLENVTQGERGQFRFWFTGGNGSNARPHTVGGPRSLDIGDAAIVDRFQNKVTIIEPGDTNPGVDGGWFVFLEDVASDGDVVTVTVGRALGASHSAIDNGNGTHDLIPGDPWYLKRFYVDGHEYNVVALMTRPGAAPGDPSEFQFITIRTPVPKGNFFNAQDTLFQQGYFLNGLPATMSVMPPFNVEHTIAVDIERLQAGDFANRLRFDACVGRLAPARPLIIRIRREAVEPRLGVELREIFFAGNGTAPAPLGWQTDQSIVIPNQYTDVAVPDGQLYLLTLNWTSPVSRLAFYGCTREAPGPFPNILPGIDHAELAAIAAAWSPPAPANIIPPPNQLNPPLTSLFPAPYYDARLGGPPVRVKLFYDPSESTDPYFNISLIDLGLNTPTPTATATRTSTATSTATRTGTSTPTVTRTTSPTASPTLTRTASPTATVTRTPTQSGGGGATSTATTTSTATQPGGGGATSTATATRTATSTATQPGGGGSTSTATATRTATATQPGGGGATSTATATRTRTPTRTPTTTVDGAPGNVSCQMGQNNDSILVQWVDQSTFETEFLIEVMVNASPFFPLDPTVPSTTMLTTGTGYASTVQPLTADTVYKFRVQARNSLGGQVSDYSNVATCQTPPQKYTGCFMGKIYLPGRSDHSGVLVTLDGMPAAVTNSWGKFEICGVKGSKHTLTTTSACYLKAMASQVNMPPGERVELPYLTLPGGDVNNDNSVNLFDLVRVGAAYRSSPPSDPEADCTKDNAVNLFDLVLVGNNYGKSGPVSWVGGGQLLARGGPPALPAADFGARRVAEHGAAGAAPVLLQTRRLSEDEIAVDVVVHEVERLYGAELVLAYDPKRVLVVDALEQGGLQILPGEIWTAGGAGFVARNAVDPEAGSIHFAAGLLDPAEPLTGDFVVATARFKVLGENAAGAYQLTSVRLANRHDQQTNEIKVRWSGFDIFPFRGLLHLPLAFKGR